MHVVSHHSQPLLLRRELEFHLNNTKRRDEHASTVSTEANFHTLARLNTQKLLGIEFTRTMRVQKKTQLTKVIQYHFVDAVVNGPIELLRLVGSVHHHELVAGRPSAVQERVQSIAQVLRQRFRGPNIISMQCELTQGAGHRVPPL